MRLIILALFAMLCGPALADTATETAGETNAYGFSLPAINGGRLEMQAFRGKAVLVVNTASYCGFTKQYDGLQALWRDYRDKGLVVLGVPSNDFGSQEPGSKEQIKEFCEVNFDIDFPMSDKLVVKGAGAHPFYKWLQDETGTAPKWNFHKYLIAPNGAAVAQFSSLTKPQSRKLIRALEAVLPHNQSP